MGSSAEDVWALAREQGGALTSAQLRLLGTSAKAQRTRVADGRLLRLRRGLFSPGTGPGRVDAAVREVAAACLAIDGAVASHETAAHLHGLELLRWVQPAIWVTVPKRPGATPAAVQGVAVQTSRLAREDVTELFGIPVTNLARTAVDLARVRELRDGLVVVDSALRRGATAEELDMALAGQRGWPGTRSARQALRLGNVLRESPLESFAAAVWAERGLAPSQPQVWIYDEYGLVGRVDEFWADQQTVGEADGLMKYSDAETLRKEKVRHERLVNAGLEVVRYTYEDLWRRPVPTALRLAEAFARGPRLPRRFLASPTELSLQGWRKGWYARFGGFPTG